jgi:hypothetical protein
MNGCVGNTGFEGTSSLCMVDLRASGSARRRLGVEVFKDRVATNVIDEMKTRMGHDRPAVVRAGVPSPVRIFASYIPRAQCPARSPQAGDHRCGCLERPAAGGICRMHLRLGSRL